MKTARWRRLAATVLGSALLIGYMSGCGSQSNSGSAADGVDNGTIHFIIPYKTQYINQLTAQAEKEAEVNGYGFIVDDSGSDLGKQLDLVAAAADSGAEAIIVLPVESDAAPSIMDAAGETKIVFLNRELADESILDADHVYIGCNEDESGIYQGKEIAEYFGELGQTDIHALLIQGDQDLIYFQKRTSIVQSTLEEAGLNVEYTILDTGDSQEEAQNVVVNTVRSADYDVIIGGSDAFALGALEGFSQLQLDVSGIPVFGIDADPNAIRAIRDGSMTGSVYQDIAQATMAVDACINLMNGNAFHEGLDYVAADNNEFIAYAPWTAVTADNVDTFQ